MIMMTSVPVPAGSPAQRAAEAEAGALQARLVALRDMQALASWLEHRPQLGHDVFARGQPEAIGTAFEPAHQVDVVEVLWASLALFDDAAADLDEACHPAVVRLHDASTARARILWLLAATPESCPSSSSCRNPRRA